MKQELIQSRKIIREGQEALLNTYLVTDVIRNKNKKPVCESYGIRVMLSDSRQTSQYIDLENITLNPTAIRRLAELMQGSAE